MGRSGLRPLGGRLLAPGAQTLDAEGATADEIRHAVVSQRKVALRCVVVLRGRGNGTSRAGLTFLAFLPRTLIVARSSLRKLRTSVAGDDEEGAEAGMNAHGAENGAAPLAGANAPAAPPAEGAAPVSGGAAVATTSDVCVQENGVATAPGAEAGDVSAPPAGSAAPANAAAPATNERKEPGAVVAAAAPASDFATTLERLLERRAVVEERVAQLRSAVGAGYSLDAGLRPLPEPVREQSHWDTVLDEMVRRRRRARPRPRSPRPRCCLDLARHRCA